MIEDAEGLVLAGGRSQRMGQDKAALSIAHHVTLLDHARDILKRTVSGPVYISRPYHWPNPSSLNLVDATDNQGPLSGILQGLKVCRRSWLAVLAVDCPNASPSLYEILYHARDATTMAIVPRHGKIRQPLISLWSPGLIPVIEDQLKQRQHRVGSALPDLVTRFVNIEDPELLANLNTPDDWEKWLLSSHGTIRL
ncbi:MAG: molybdenum cofactor guanylyltransferase [Firmicutes bacterium]|nr:molybdenum cofactor guanylyltransferase [Bacillota bacterium]